MEPKLHIMFLLVIFTSIGQTCSAVFLKFQTHSAKDYYFNSRSASNHRGLLLSYSSIKKNKICTDLFSETVSAIIKMKSKRSIFQNSFKADITAGDINEGGQKMSSVIGRISAISKLYILNDHNKDIFFKCIIKDLSDTIYFDQKEYFVSSAFGSGLMYASHQDYIYEEEMNVILKKYLLISPEFVSLEQNQLEWQYVMTRRKINALEEESGEYIELINQKDSISELSTWQTFLICSSIILSPIQKNDLHKFSLDWTDYKENALKENTSRFENKHLAFKNGALKNEKWTADCVNCWSSAEIVSVFSKTTVNLFFTRTHDDKHSVYVLKEEKGVMYLSDYIKNVPVLMNSRVPITNDPPPDLPNSVERYR